uniref:Sulfotransferase family protein n=1 Tax=Alloyangia mangrovi TaxID=1779329 RepID=A0A2A3JSE1_9RHOB
MIAAFVVSLLAVAGFGLGLWRSRVVPVCRTALGTAMTGITAMMDSELDDAAKEIAVRRAGFALIGAAFGIFWRFALSLALAALPVLAADLIGLVPREAVLSLMLRLDYIFVVSVAAIAGAEALRRLRGPGRHDPEALPEINRYSTADRFFHMLAFASPVVLKSASKLEDRLMPGAMQEPSGPPIFVTSLARGGTTALLNALHEVPAIATHTYRDMPFVTAPALWNRLAGGRGRDVGGTSAPMATGSRSTSTVPRPSRRCCGRRSGPASTAPKASRSGRPRTVIRRPRPSSPGRCAR